MNELYELRTIRSICWDLHIRLRPTWSASHPNNTWPIKLPTGDAILRPRSTPGSNWLSTSASFCHRRIRRGKAHTFVVDVPDHFGGEVDGENVVSGKTPSSAVSSLGGLILTHP